MQKKNSDVWEKVDLTGYTTRNLISYVDTLTHSPKAYVYIQDHGSGVG